MNRIRLALVRGPHRSSMDAGIHVTATRVVTKLIFATDSDWTDFESLAIVDSGAPLSLLPQSTWRQIRRSVLATVTVGGVTEKPECKFTADLALIQCLFSDGATLLGPFELHALLAHNDKVPILLGLSGALERTELFLSLGTNSAYLQQV